MVRAIKQYNSNKLFNEALINVCIHNWVSDADETFDKLLQMHPDVLKKSTQYVTALHVSLLMPTPILFYKLLAKGASFHKKIEGEYSVLDILKSSSSDERSAMLLHKKIFKNYRQEVYDAFALWHRPAYEKLVIQIEKEDLLKHCESKMPVTKRVMSRL